MNKAGKQSVAESLKWKACRSVVRQYEISPVTLSWVSFVLKTVRLRSLSRSECLTIIYFKGISHECSSVAYCFFSMKAMFCISFLSCIYVDSNFRTGKLRCTLRCVSLRIKLFFFFAECRKVKD